MMSAKSLVQEIGKVRWWFEGYKAGGGEPPHGLEALRQAQVIFDYCHHHDIDVNTLIGIKDTSVSS